MDEDRRAQEVEVVRIRGGKDARRAIIARVVTLCKRSLGGTGWFDLGVW